MPSFRYVHDLSPFLFHIELAGHEVGVRWYGLAYVLGLSCAFLAFRRAAGRGFLPGLDDQAQQQMIFAIVAGVMGGGRLGYVLQHPARLLANPLFFFEVWEGGMAFFGGLAGVILAMLWTARRYAIPFWRLADVATFPAAFGLGVGRIANFINGELWGRPTASTWGVIFPRADSLPRHPSQLYEAASHFLLLGLLMWAWRRQRTRVLARPGGLACLFLAGYGALRFLSDFYRDDDTYWGPWSSGQWASLLVMALGIVLGLRLLSRSHPTTGTGNENNEITEGHEPQIQAPDADPAKRHPRPV
jgi:phosphatidylglycerol:prolipoprotein diacylglycerol transferase